MPTTEPPRGHVKIVYLGPVAPHWEIRSDFGDPQIINDFRLRVNARLMLLPPHDPQFRRNRERVNRDAERENFMLEWDLGYEEDDSPAVRRGLTRRGRRGGTCGRRPSRGTIVDGRGAGDGGCPTVGRGPEPYLNRELSWLDFNGRVLTLAANPAVPLLERAKFLAIFSSNLDEFFQVRVAGLKDQVARGSHPSQPTA